MTLNPDDFKGSKDACDLGAVGKICRIVSEAVDW
jgi:hypothetical protein